MLHCASAEIVLHVINIIVKYILSLNPSSFSLDVLFQPLLPIPQSLALSLTCATLVDHQHDDDHLQVVIIFSLHTRTWWVFFGLPMVCVCFSSVTDHCAGSQSQNAYSQRWSKSLSSLIIHDDDQYHHIMAITWSWECVQISSEQRRVADYKRSCRIEETLLIFYKSKPKCRKYDFSS